MTLSTLIITFAIAGALLTVVMRRFIQKPKSWFVSWLQNFCGVWFLFSGFVKAVDPMGTAFKMEQYFAAFEQTIKPTWMGFVSGVFPYMARYSIGFSIGMIWLEILVGLALIIGFAPRFISWVFFILLIFFTILTGFTYLTGYVPSDKNFFDFSAWGDYDKNQMRVSDCGCFGDFLKLDPKISFFKDVFLLVPGLIFLIWSRVRHQLFSAPMRWILMLGGLALTAWFTHRNTYSNEPLWDFRAFKAGADIRNTRKAELQAAQEAKIEFADATYKKTGEKKRLDYAEYMKDFKKYPKDEWTIKFVYSEPKVAKTKVSDFDILDINGRDITEPLLNEPGYSLVVSAYKVHGRLVPEKIKVKDSVFIDSIYVVNNDTVHNRKFNGMVETEKVIEVFNPADEDQSRFEKINAIANSVLKNGIKVYGVTGGLGTSSIRDLIVKTKADYPVYQADDILLKTMMRSDPGLILWHDGKIIRKWHHEHLPSVNEVMALTK